VGRHAKQQRAGDVTNAFTYAELDEILRGTGHAGAIGMSAIDGLIAALVAAPSFVHPEEWIPLIFGGRQPPLEENSPELHAVKTIFNRYNEVSDVLADRPQAYRPIFMIDTMTAASSRATGRSASPSALHCVPKSGGRASCSPSTVRC
jgi:yecA family protein